MAHDDRTMETKLVHAGEPRPRLLGAVSMPVFQSANYEYAGEAGYDAVRYIRLNNTPNHLALGEKLAAIEGAEAAVVTGSGMAAITTALLTLLPAGSHVLAQRGLYGGTHDFVTRDLETFGVAYDLVDGEDPDEWKQRLRPSTRAFYVESTTNPLLDVADLEAVAAFAREHRLTSLIDNTFPSPVNFRPIEHGFDVSLHSCTKYLNGHSDIVAGAIVGGRDTVARMTSKLNHLGGTLDPHACFLLQRGMKTLALRVERQNASALALARALEAHPQVARVRYPGLASHPQHERAKRLFAGRFGGMVSLELSGGRAAADRLVRSLSIAVCAPSLGGVESLVTIPATTSHAGLDPEERRRLGISDGLVRVSVGIESAEDLVADFTRALDALGG